MSRIPGNPSNRFWLYLLPGFLMLLWIIIVPAVWNIYLSFTNYRGTGAAAVRRSDQLGEADEGHHFLGVVL